MAAVAAPRKRPFTVADNTLQKRNWQKKIRMSRAFPFLIAALMIEQFSSLFARMKRHLANVERAMGVLMVITGIGFLTGSVSAISIWLLETFPSLQNFG